MEIVNKFHLRYLDFRALDRLIHQDSFRRAWDAASNIGRKDVKGFLDKEALEAVKKWIDHWESIPLNERSFRRLREKASNMNVPGYSRMDRSQLILKLQELDNGV